MSIDTLLSRFSKVKKIGHGKWAACCPAHADKSPSLHIQLKDDGKILIKDFGGCDVQSVVAAVGMDLSDLFPAKDAAAPRYRRPVFNDDALKCLQHELTVVLIASKNMPLNEVDQARFELAVQRISDGLDYVRS